MPDPPYPSFSASHSNIDDFMAAPIIRQSTERVSGIVVPVYVILVKGSWLEILDKLLCGMIAEEEIPQKTTEFPELQPLFSSCICGKKQIQVDGSRNLLHLFKGTVVLLGVNIEMDGGVVKWHFHDLAGVFLKKDPGTGVS